MILVDTSVWVDHFNQKDTYVHDQLAAGNLAIHIMVIGELACGNLRNRATTMSNLYKIPRLAELSHDSVIEAIEREQLMGKGIGFIDAHLICTTLQHKGARLWTRDRRLFQLADELGVAFNENESDSRE